MPEEEQSSSPPLEQSQSLDATPSQWDLPPLKDPAASFQYSKAPPAGLGSEGKTGASVGPSATHNDADSGSRPSSEAKKSALSTVGQAGKGDNPEATVVRGAQVGKAPNWTAAGGFEFGRAGEGDSLRGTVGEKGAGGQDQPVKAASQLGFAERFKLGNSGAFGPLQKKTSPSNFSPGPASAADTSSPTINASRFDSAVGASGWKLPAPSQIAPQRFSNQSQNSLARFPHASNPPRSPVANTPQGPAPANSSHQQPPPQQLPPRRVSAPVSPHSGQLQPRRQQENVQPVNREGSVGQDIQAPNNSKKRGTPASDSGVVRLGSKESAGEVQAKVQGRSRGRSPSAKKRRSDKGERTGPMAMEDIIAGIASYKTHAETRDAEIAALRIQLTDKERSLERLQTANETLKREAMGKVNLALSRLEGARKELCDTTMGMRTVMSQLEADTGSLGGVKQLRSELSSVKQLFEGRYFSEEGHLWLERNEESRVVALRTLQTEVQQRQDVIALLRDQLATKTGEIVESRDRIALLEQGQVSQAQTLLEIEKVRKDASAREEELHQRRLAAEKRLDDALVKSREREEVLEEELRILRTTAEEQKQAISSLDITNAALLASNSRLESEAQSQHDLFEGLNMRFEALELSKRDVQTSLDNHRAEARAESERLQAAIRDSRIENEGHETRLARQLVELEQLRPLPEQLAKVKLDLRTLEKQMASDEDAAAEALQRAKTVAADTQARCETLASQLKVKEDQLVKEGKSLLLSKATVVELESNIASFRSREKELEVRAEEAADQLRSAQAEIESLLHQRQTTSTQGAQSDGAHLEELKSLHLQIANLRASNDALEREKAKLSQQITQLNEMVATLTKEKESLAEEKGRALAEVRRIEEQLAQVIAARDDLLHLHDDVAQLKRDQETLLKKRAKETYDSCQDSHAREKAQLTNELKRSNNRADELQKRVTKLSTELAKSKNRPLIDPHIASSSPFTPPRDQQDLPVEKEQHVEPPQQAPASDESSSHTVGTTLTAIEAMDEDGAEDDIQIIAIDTSPKAAEAKAEEPAREVAVHVPAISVPAAVKKDKGKSASKVKGEDIPPSRPQRTTRRRTIEPEPREGDEDEIEDIATQEVTGAGPRGKSRPSAKTTYATKKRKDVKRD